MRRTVDITRREFLRIGGLAGLGGLVLPAFLQGIYSAASSGKTVRPRARSCLLVFMEGGPSHVDLFDMKPDAPAEVRGEFKPIATRVPGLQICDQFPRLARQIHHLTLIRSVTHGITDHNAGTYQSLTGRHPVENARLITADGPTNFPCFGAVLARERPLNRPLPPVVHIPEVMSNNNQNIAGQGSGFFGAAYAPLVSGDPSLPGFHIPGVTPWGDVPVDRLDRRAALLERLDRSVQSATADRMSVFARKALAMISSPETRKAFDLSQEPLSVRERYGIDHGSDRSIEAREFGGLPQLGQSMLLARRLIEAGVRLVTVCTGRRIDQAWDTHRKHFSLLRESLCPYFDRAFSALLEDLALRGLLQDTLVVVMGEFGRTPKLGQIVSGAGATANGRDHWPYCYSMFIGGAGLPAGAVLGSSDAQGGYPKSDPVTPADVAATVYTLMGVNPEMEIHDAEGRGHQLVRGKVIKKLM